MTTQRALQGTAKTKLRSAHVLTTTAAVLWLATLGYGQDKVDDTFLVYTQELAIKFKNLNKVSEGYVDEIQPVPIGHEFICLDVDAHDNSVYFSDIYNQSGIQRIYTNGTGRREIAKKIQVEHLALDWVAKNIYYVERGGRALNVLSTRNTTNIRVLFNGTDVRKFRLIVLHPNKGYMFYAIDDVSFSVSRAYMDGSNVINLDLRQFYSLTGLAVDFATDRLYGCDPYLKKVFHSNLDLTDVLTIKFESILPMELVVLTDWMYVIEYRGVRVIKLQKLTGFFDKNAVQPVPELEFRYGTDYLYNLKIYSKHQQPVDNTHPCSIAADYGGCQKLCFAVPSNKSTTSSLQALCGCPSGEKLDPNGKTCVIDSYPVTTVTTFVVPGQRNSAGTSKLIKYRFVTSMSFVLVHLITVYLYLG